nr:hypothetical protein [Bacteroidota bacterium]
FGIELQPRIYFGDHVGMYFNVGYAGYSYPSIEFSDNQNYYNSNNFKFTLKGSGVNLGLGLIGKF